MWLNRMTTINSALILNWWEIEIISFFDCENKGLEIDNNDKWNENNTQQHCPFHDQAIYLEQFHKPFKKFIHLYD